MNKTSLPKQGWFSLNWAAAVLAACCWTLHAASPLAPSSISGKVVVATTTQPQAGTSAALYADTTFTGLGGRTRYGSYTWTKLDNTRCTLVQVEEAPDDRQGDRTSLTVHFHHRPTLAICLGSWSSPAAVLKW